MRSTISTRPSTPVMRTWAPAGTSGPRSDHFCGPSWTSPAPFSMPCRHGDDLADETLAHALWRRRAFEIALLHRVLSPVPESERGKGKYDEPGHGQSAGFFLRIGSSQARGRHLNSRPRPDRWFL